MPLPFLRKYKLETSITSYCKIRNRSVWVNEDLFFEGSPAEDLGAFLGTAYKKAELNYPKFFKMDKLCKLGTLATELMIRTNPGFNELPKQEMALVFANSASSLDSDRNHANAISDKQNYFPSPSVFVYTLPNILIGEIAIKHKITGENAFFVSEAFDAELLFSYSRILLEKDNASSVVCGWVNVDGQSAEAFVYCVKKLNFKQENHKAHNSKNIQHLYSL